MSIRAVQTVIDRSKAKGSDLLVLILIANKALDDGTPAWIPQKTLCKESRLCARAVNYVLKRLQEADELDILANTDNDIPVRAKFAPKRFYRIRCLANGQGGESHRQTLHANFAGEDKANAKFADGDRHILQVPTCKVCRRDLKEGSVQGSVQGSVRPRGDLEYLNKAAPAKAKGAPSTKAFDTKPDDDEEEPESPATIRRRMAAELARQRVAQKRFH